MAGDNPLDLGEVGPRDRAKRFHELHDVRVADAVVDMPAGAAGRHQAGAAELLEMLRGIAHAEAGFQVVPLAGGLKGWREAGLPVEEA